MDQIRSEHRALAILRVLEREAGYSSNERVLGDYLDRLALGGVREEIRASLETLERFGLLKCDWCEALMIVTLTEHGQEAATGRRIVEGVLRPGPDCPY